MATVGSHADQLSARVDADLMSTIGVPSNASIGPIFTRVSSILRTVTGCSRERISAFQNLSFPAFSQRQPAPVCKSPSCPTLFTLPATQLPEEHSENLAGAP